MLKVQQDIQVQKRDGRLVSFDNELILRAIQKAFCAERQLDDLTQLDEATSDKIELMVDESKNVIPELVNELARTEEGKTKLLRVINETEHIDRLATVINQVTAVATLTTLMSEMTNEEGSNTNGISSMVALLSFIEQPTELANLINGIQGEIPKNTIYSTENTIAY